MKTKNKKKSELKRYFTFITGGAISTGIGVLITFLLTKYLHMWYMLSFAIALCIEIIFLFAYHTYITFKTKGDFIKFTMNIIIISFLNWIFVYFFSVIVGINYVISILFVALIISVLNYTVNKILIFKNTKLIK